MTYRELLSKIVGLDQEQLDSDVCVILETHIQKIFDVSFTTCPSKNDEVNLPQGSPLMLAEMEDIDISDIFSVDSLDEIYE